MDSTTKKKSNQLIQWLAAFASCMTNFCTGISNGWPSPNEPKLLRNDSPIPATASQTAMLIYNPFIATILLMPVSGLISHHFGRKFTILVSFVPFLASSILIWAAQDIETLGLARTLAGIGTGLTASIPPIYITEISDVEIRGRLLSMFQFTYQSGVLFTYTTARYCTISTQALISACFPALMILILLFMPESPYFYLMKNNEKKAIRTVQILKRQKDVTFEIETMKQDIEKENVTVNKMKILSDPGLRTAFLSAAVLVYIHQASGITCVITYTESLFQSTGITSDLSSIVGIVLQVISVLTSFLGLIITDRVGKKPLYLTSLGAMASFSLFLSAFFFAKYMFGFDTTHFTFLPIIIIILFGSFYIIGLGNLSLAMASEYIPPEYKSFVITIISMLDTGVFLFFTYVFKLIWNRAGISVCFLLFGSLSALNFVYTIFRVPETSNKTFQEIYAYFGIKLNGSDDVKTKSDESKDAVGENTRV